MGRQGRDVGGKGEGFRGRGRDAGGRGRGRKGCRRRGGGRMLEEEEDCKIKEHGLSERGFEEKMDTKRMPNMT